MAAANNATTMELLADWVCDGAVTVALFEVACPPPLSIGLTVSTLRNAAIPPIARSDDEKLQVLLNAPDVATRQNTCWTMFAVDVELTKVQPDGAVIVGVFLTTTWAINTSPAAGDPLHVPLLVASVSDEPPPAPLFVVQYETSDELPD